MPDSICEKCGGVALFREGVSKSSGKPYKGYFCQDRENCNHVKFLRTQGQGIQSSPSPDIKEDIALLNQRLTDLGTYLENKFSELKAEIVFNQTGKENDKEKRSDSNSQS